MPSATAPHSAIETRVAGMSGVWISGMVNGRFDVYAFTAGSDPDTRITLIVKSRNRIFS